MPGLTDERPIFVVGNLKSGTSLAQSLFDGHPELYVVPAEIQFFKFPRIFSLTPGNMPAPPAPDWQVPIPREQEGLEDVKREVLQSGEVATLLQSGEVGRNIALSDEQFDRARFRQVVARAEVSDLRELYLVLVRAFAAATDRTDADREIPQRFVEKCPHMEEYAVLLKSWFPDASFVHLVRNPYANLFSLQKGLVRKRDFRDRFLRPMAKSFYFLERNRRCLDDYHVVRYEDLVLDTRSQLERLTEELDIEYRPSLESPTILGEPWSGNPQSVEGTFDDIDPRPVDAFRDHIPALQVALINRFFGPFLKEYSYTTIDPGPWRPWLPMWFEAPTHYAANRRLWLAGKL